MTLLRPPPAGALGGSEVVVVLVSPDSAFAAGLRLQIVYRTHVHG